MVRKPAWLVDPESLDELWDLSRLLRSASEILFRAARSPMP